MKSVIYKSVLLPAPAEKLFEMYLDSKAHSAFTGMPAEIDGSDFKAFNGMLNGNILQVVKPKLIVQSWRSIAFNEEDTDSTLIINFSQEGENGRIDLVHIDVPEHAFEGVKEGWDKRYFIPWKEYLENKTK